MLGEADKSVFHFLLLSPASFSQLTNQRENGEPINRNEKPINLILNTKNPKIILERERGLGPWSMTVRGEREPPSLDYQVSTSTTTTLLVFKY